MEKYKNLEEAMCRELDKMNKKYATETTDMTASDAERVDMLFHALKSAETYGAMKEASEMESMEMESGRRGGGRSSYGPGSSYARRRDSMGRFTSRDMDGYSGHYPPYPMYDEWRY